MVGCNEVQDEDIHLQGETVRRVETFTYLESTLTMENSVRKSHTHTHTHTECRAG